MAGAAGAGVNRQSIFAGSEDSVNEWMAGVSLTTGSKNAT